MSESTAKTELRPNGLPIHGSPKTIRQMPNYPDSQAVDTAVQSLAKLPPLVTSWEVES